MQFDLLGGMNPAQSMDLNTSKGFVLSGINDWLNTSMSNVNKKYSGAGFGSGVQSQAVYNASAKPYVQAGANQARSAMTDLYEKDRDFKERQRQFDLLRKDRSYLQTEQENTLKQNKAEADKWYNWL